MKLFRKKEPTMEEIRQNMMQVGAEHKTELPPLPEYRPPQPQKEEDLQNSDIAEALEFFYQLYKSDAEIISKNQLQLNTSLVSLMTQLQRLEIELINENKKKK